MDETVVEVADVASSSDAEGAHTDVPEVMVRIDVREVAAAEVGRNPVDTGDNTKKDGQEVVVAVVDAPRDGDTPPRSIVVGNAVLRGNAAEIVLLDVHSDRHWHRHPLPRACHCHPTRTPPMKFHWHRLFPYPDCDPAPSWNA